MSLRHNEEEKKQWEEEKRLAGVKYSPIQKSEIREIWRENGSIPKSKKRKTFLLKLVLVGTFIKQCIVEINNIFLPGAKEEEERKEKELLKTRVRELEEEVVKNWVIPLKMLILRLLEIGNNSGVDRTTSVLLSMETQGGKIERTSKEIGRNAGSCQKSGFLIKKRTLLSLSPFFPRSYQVSLQPPISLSFIRET